MKVQIEDFQTGWYGLSIGVKKGDIKALITALKQLEENQGHFHLTSDMVGDGGVADIEIFLQEESEVNNIEIDISRSIYSNPKNNKTK